ncbi:MAG: plastocyanin/azurin family copper-binding protein [Candidatus Krumholzibacteria bacterium]|nr:plastocyanin/azurin family copper-binding protein [Candidatus Krumholzibacteria bacterium]
MRPVTLTWIFPFAFAGVLLAAGCGEDASPTNGGTPAVFNGVVRVVDNQFIPASAAIAAGDSVTWRFEGSASHTVTEGTGPTDPGPLFDSGLRNSGTFGYRFTSAGTFQYYCNPHFAQGMRGTITVAGP